MRILGKGSAATLAALLAACGATQEGHVLHQTTTGSTRGAAGSVTSTGSGSSVAGGSGSGSGETSAGSTSGPSAASSTGSATASSGATSTAAASSSSASVAASGSAGASSTSSGSSAGSSSGGTTGQSSGGAVAWPVVPDQGGPILPSPHLVMITYDDDPNASTWEQFGVWISDGGYLPLVAGQYGVGNGTVQFLTLDHNTSPAPTGTTTDTNAFPDYIDQLMGANQLPAFDASQVYVFMLPASWGDTAALCDNDIGYHAYFTNTDGTVPLYIVVPFCPGETLQDIEAVISHEVVEAATDPDLATNIINDPSSPWTYLGGELGDLCMSNTTYDRQGPYAAQLIWSNDAAMDGGVPCQPWNPSQVYFSPLAPSAIRGAAAGTQVTLPVTGWSSLPFSGSMDLAIKNTYMADFDTTAQLSAGTVAPGASVNVTLNIPSNAQPGDYGAAWIVAADPTTKAVEGSAIVAVVVQ